MQNLLAEGGLGKQPSPQSGGLGFDGSSEPRRTPELSRRGRRAPKPGSGSIPASSSPIPLHLLYPRVRN